MLFAIKFVAIVEGNFAFLGISVERQSGNTVDADTEILQGLPVVGSPTERGPSVGPGFVAVLPEGHRAGLGNCRIKFFHVALLLVANGVLFVAEVRAVVVATVLRIKKIPRGSTAIVDVATTFSAVVADIRAVGPFPLAELYPIPLVAGQVHAIFVAVTNSNILPVYIFRVLLVPALVAGKSSTPTLADAA